MPSELELCKSGCYCDKVRFWIDGNGDWVCSLCGNKI